jgi:protein-disulfide isomerase
VTDPTAPVGGPASHRRTGSSGRLTTALSIVAVLALGTALSTWVVTSRQIGQLQRQVADLQEAHRDLTRQLTDGRSEASAVGAVLDLAGAPALGPANAVVTLVEFSDYECPFCIRHFHQTMPQLQANYIGTGKIRYVFRDFPIDQNHPQAIRAHEAAHCALEQQRFWDLHPRLFSAPGTHTPIALEDLARDAKLDDSRFRACIASGQTTAAIRKSVQLVESLGATGTPWFLVGLRDPKTDQLRVLKSMGGAQPYEEFARVLDDALKQASTN